VAKWIIKATPIPSHPEIGYAGAESWLYSTDKQAKAHVRELVAKHRLVRVQSAPGIKPTVTMDHGEALRWAND
jgi:hypothetical protein